MESSRSEMNNDRRSSILVSNLCLFTDYDTVEKYFGQFGTVKEVAFIHADDLTYTRSCEVVMQSTDSVTNILAMPHHVIDEREVTVEPYLGREAHEWLFLEGDYKLILKGLDVSQHESVLYKKLEKAFANCGRYSEIHLMKTPKGGLSGVAQIDFINKEDIPKALKIAHEELNSGHQMLFYAVVGGKCDKN
ncbi:putative RNA recognition motif domain, nucleotide-binding alpha-beta plait domain superfamily [Helianthus annuus]|nr:putative RNA recognition motif domain, nucleotide-binding alpha-beta plait domain superfamily [Helianthus annuus]